jgi:protease-4
MNRKRWLALILFLLVVFLVVVGLGRLTAPEKAKGRWQETTLFGQGERVLLLELKGTIPTDKALEDFLSQVRQAREDPGIKAVVLEVVSPGGGVTETEAIHRALKELAREKPLVASLGWVAASGGYYAATAAREIVTAPTTVTGSIGVISIRPQVQGLLDKLGVEVEVLKEGKFKDMTSGLRPLTPEEKAVIQGYMREAYELFVRRVAEGRRMPLEKAYRLADGRIYSGAQALALGLADREGYLEDAAQRAAELAGLTGFRLVRYKKPKGLLVELLGDEPPFGFTSDTQALLQALAQSRFRLEYRYLGGGLW